MFMGEQKIKHAEEQGVVPGGTGRRIYGKQEGRLWGIESRVYGETGRSCGGTGRR